MTPEEKKQKAQELAVKGQALVSEAETILGEVIVRNARLRQEMRQTRTELEAKLAARTE